jgi:hypothetical protein
MVVANTGAYVSGLVSATGNVSGGNITSPGVISATGNMIAANISTAGIVTATTVSATGNISGGNLTVGSNIAMLSNVARYTWVSNVAPTGGQGAVGDIWYQTV